VPLCRSQPEPALDQRIAVLEEGRPSKGEQVLIAKRTVDEPYLQKLYADRKLKCTVRNYSDVIRPTLPNSPRRSHPPRHAAVLRHVRADVRCRLACRVPEHLTDGPCSALR
jgi:hypothetical protein